MSEAVILPEMLQAGIEALSECEARAFTNVDTVIAVYLAMVTVLEISEMRKQVETVH